jgi:hypothetical protein
MSKLVPLILELDEELGENEELIDIKTIGIRDGHSNVLHGYVGVIKNFSGNFDVRYGNLRAVRYEKANIGKYIL